MQQQQPLNMLSGFGFTIDIPRAPITSFTVVRAAIPAISASPVNIATPFKALPMGGDKIDYSTFDITFKLEENIKNWYEIWRWMVGVNAPTSFQEHAQYVNENGGIFSDITLTLLSSANKMNMQFTFVDAFPTSMGQVDLQTNSTIVDYADTTVSFAYSYMNVKTLV